MGIVTAVAQVTPVAQVHLLPQEHTHATGTAKKKKKKKKVEIRMEASVVIRNVFGLCSEFLAELLELAFPER